jgi:hypothetical protein
LNSSLSSSSFDIFTRLMAALAACTFFFC